MSAKKGDRRERSFVCVNCGEHVKSVYVEYSPGNIRLSNCVYCQGIVDKYVEYEIMIVIMDVILHKSDPYRHVFFNYPQLNRLNWQAYIWKAICCSLFLDTWRWANFSVEDETLIEWDTLARFFITAGKVVAQVGLLNCVYLAVIILVLDLLSRRDFLSKFKEISLAVLFSSHFKFFVLAMMVWEFSPLMGFMVDMLILSSNTVALKVILNTTSLHAATAVISASTCRYFASTLLRHFSG